MADHPIFIQPGQDPATKIAAATSGLIGGINEYSKYQTEKQLATQKMQAGLLSHGLVADEEGNVHRGPVAEAQYKQQQDEMDPASDMSRQFREYGRGLINKAGLDPGFIQESDETGKGGTSAYTIKQYIKEAGPAMRMMGTQQRLGVSLGNQAVHAADTFDKDSNLQKLTQQQQQIQRGKHTLDSVSILTPQMFNEIQMDIANAISGGKSAAVSTQNKVEFSTLETEFQGLKQRLTNKPQDIQSPEIKKYIGEVLDRLNDAYSNNMYGRAQQLAKGRSKAYGSNPAALEVMNEKVGSYKPAEHKGLLKEAVDPKDQAAIQWAQDNPDDPRSAQILKLHGM